MNLTLESIKEEQYSMTSQEWEEFFLPQKIEEMQILLLGKNRRLEHCINFVADDSIHTDGEKIWIESPGKLPEDFWYVNKDSDQETIQMFIDFYQCSIEKEILPEEISNLEEIIAYLYSSE